MGALFSDKVKEPRRRGPDSYAPPPPGAAGSFFGDESEPEPLPLPKKPLGLKFDAELDVSELDDRDRPGPVWIARGRELGRGHIAFRSRRMCYQGRRILVAVHLIDDKPVPLFGIVRACEYDVDGLYRVELDLHPLPDRPEIAVWMEQRSQ
jgi:hypothetical protein